MDAETVIAISFGAILAVFSFSVVYYTFMHARQYGSAEADALVTADDQELADIFDAINTLDLEYKLGRLAENEFRTQFHSYRVQAAEGLPPAAGIPKASRGTHWRTPQLVGWSPPGGSGGH